MSDKVELNFATAGDTRNPALLFLHGFMGSLQDWRPVIDELSSSHYCLTVELPWHGDSPKLPASAHPFRHTTDALINLLDSLSVESCTVVGYSMGGRIAMSAAVQYPGRFSRLVIESANPGIRSPEERAIRRRREKEMAARLRNNDMREFVDFWYSQPLFESLRAHAAFEQLVQARLRNDPAALAEAMTALGSGSQPDFWDAIGDYPGPMLFLAGERDAKYAALAQQLKQRRPHTAVAVIPGCGHNIHFEKCAIFCKKVVEFLDKKK